MVAVPVAPAVNVRPGGSVPPCTLMVEAGVAWTWYVTPAVPTSNLARPVVGVVTTGPPVADEEMASVWLVVPAELVAVTLAVTSAVAVTVPATRTELPVAEVVGTRPAGSVVTVTSGAGTPVAVTLKAAKWPVTIPSLAGDVMTGAEPTVRSRVWVAVPEADDP